MGVKDVKRRTHVAPQIGQRTATLGDKMGKMAHAPRPSP
jgi:hypothetical protein